MTVVVSFQQPSKKKLSSATFCHSTLQMSLRILAIGKSFLKNLLAVEFSMLELCHEVETRLQHDTCLESSMARNPFWSNLEIEKKTSVTKLSTLHCDIQSFIFNVWWQKETLISSHVERTNFAFRVRSFIVVLFWLFVLWRRFIWQLFRDKTLNTSYNFYFGGVQVVTSKEVWTVNGS